MGRLGCGRVQSPSGSAHKHSVLSYEADTSSQPCMPGRRRQGISSKLMKGEREVRPRCVREWARAAR
jgi:hypothetical protein